MFAKEQEHLVSPTYFSKEYHEEVNAQGVITMVVSVMPNFERTTNAIPVSTKHITKHKDSLATTARNLSYSEYLQKSKPKKNDGK